jgi:RHS repeat-associated protein
MNRTRSCFPLRICHADAADSADESDVSGGCRNRGGGCHWLVCHCAVMPIRSPVRASALVTLFAVLFGSTAAHSQQVATPTLSLSSGTYDAGQQVIISDATDGATIYYTTDGTAPTTSSQHSLSPLTLALSETATHETIRAMASASGYTNSSNAGAVYSISTGIVLPPAGTIDTIAGPGNFSLSSNTGLCTTGGLAVNATIGYPQGVALDSNRDVYIADPYCSVVYKVTASTGVISILAGTLNYNEGGWPTGDGGPATSANLNWPSGVAVDSSGNVYIADAGDDVIREVSAATGIINIEAGNYLGGYSGDGGAAASATLNTPQGVAVDPSGNVYIADSGNARVRVVCSASAFACAGKTLGDIYTVAEPGAMSAIAVDNLGNIYTSGNDVINEISPAGLISTVAGVLNSAGFGGDGGPATSALMDYPEGVAVDTNGNVYISDYGNCRVREVTFPNGGGNPGIINTIAGGDDTGYDGCQYNGDYIPATSAGIFYPFGIAVDASGNVYVADWQNFRVRAIGSAMTTPTINWPTPASIAYGTALSVTQLNASASVSGTQLSGQFVYSPPAGTVLYGGTQMLSVTFTPDNTAQYTTVQASVPIYVNPGSGPSDIGTITLTVNGSSGPTVYTTSYQAGSTASSIAAGLASGLSCQSGQICPSPISVVPVDNNLYLQATSSGADTNYSYSLAATSHTFPSASFVSAPISGNMEGGSGASSSSGVVYCYGPPGSTLTTTEGTTTCSLLSNPIYDAVGNVLGDFDSVMGTWDFTYDSLNRLVTANASRNPYPYSNYCWAYDGFGNRLIEAESNQPFAVGSPAPDGACQPAEGQDVMFNSSWALFNGTVNGTANNQMNATSQNVNQGSGYDAAGNVTYDGLNQYLYDGEGRICAVAESVNGTTWLTGYIYNAEGERVSKGSITSWSCDPTQNGFQATNDYVIGPGGEQWTEWGINSGTPTWQHTNVWADGQLMATNDPDGWHFYLNDPLSTRRVQTDQGGVVEQECASLPFGDGLNCINPNPGGSNYAGSLTAPTEHHFTGKEHDSESNNDYFGARYYASSMGRWLSPDPINLTNARLMNPANTLNKYVYGANNPLKYVDQDGKDITIFYIPPSNPFNPFDTGHVLVGAVNQDTGASAVMNFYPNVTAPSPSSWFNIPVPGKFESVDDALVASSLTIRTTPDEANTVIAAIKKLESGQAPNYQDISNNCTTEVEDVLKDIGLIDPGDWDPNQYWFHMYSNYSAAAMQNPFAAFGPIPHAEGQEYGNPRNMGMSYGNLFWLLQFYSGLPEPKATVTTTETVTLPDGTTQSY